MSSLFEMLFPLEAMRLAALEQQRTADRTKLTQLEARIVDTQTKLTLLQATVEQQEGAQNAQLAALQTAVDALQAGKQDLTGIQSQLDQHALRIDQATATIDAVIDAELKARGIDPAAEPPPPDQPPAEG